MYRIKPGVDDHLKDQVFPLFQHVCLVFSSATSAISTRLPGFLEDYQRWRLHRNTWRCIRSSFHFLAAFSCTGQKRSQKSVYRSYCTTSGLRGAATVPRTFLMPTITRSTVRESEPPKPRSLEGPCRGALRGALGAGWRTPEFWGTGDRRRCCVFGGPPATGVRMSLTVLSKPLTMRFLKLIMPLWMPENMFLMREGAGLWGCAAERATRHTNVRAKTRISAEERERFLWAIT